MKNIIIQGFASNEFLFEKIKKNIPNCIVLKNEQSSYKEAKYSLDYYSTEGKINIFGWSLGSLFALKWTLENPSKVNSLFLTGATARFTQTNEYENGILLENLLRMKRMIKIRTKQVLTDFYKNIFEFVENKEQIINSLLETTISDQSLENGLSELIEIDLLKQLLDIKVKTAIFQGARDNTTPLYGAEIIRNKIKNSTLKVYNGGHCYFLEYPDECIENWRNFI